MAENIAKGDPRWETLMSIWVAEGKPGYVVTRGGASYRVHQPSDEEVLFVPMQGIDDLYNSQSTMR